MLLYDLTPDYGSSEGHTKNPDSCNIGIKVKFEKALTAAITCHFTCNKTIAYATIPRETSRQISHNVYSADYVLSAVCEFVSRRLFIGSSNPTFYSAVLTQRPVRTG